MSIVRVGSTKKYSDGWESAFSGKGKKKTAKKTAAKKPAAKKSSAKKKASAKKKKSAKR